MSWKMWRLDKAEVSDVEAADDRLFFKLDNADEREPRDVSF
jgi:hypothetical protein